MAVADIRWPMDGQRQRHTLATDTVLDLCRDLTLRFRTQRAPMPLVVLQAQDDDPDGRVTEIVDVLHAVYCEGRLLCKEVVPGSGTGAAVPDHLRHYDHALAMVRSLTATAGWDNQRRCQYRPYVFPRSRMLEAIEDAVAATHQARGDGNRPAADAVLERLGKLRWRPARSASSAVRRVVGPLFSPATLIGACVLVGATRLLTQASAPVLAGVLAVAVALLTVTQVVRQNTAPLSWLGQASRWFATTTFLAPTTFLARVSRSAPGWLRWGPRRSWEAVQARARLVAEQLVVAEYGGAAGSGLPPDSVAQERALQFYLQLRVLALLEDLRANHRPWAMDLRRRKRTWPPMVFLPGAGEDNGGLTLLGAISDVRSRRSEQDPLLVLASVPGGIDIERRQLSGLPPRARGDAEQGLYAAWATAMRVGQSPSLGSTWPWVLRLPLRRERLADQSSDKHQPRARRSIWALWSRWTLAMALLILLGTGVLRGQQLADRYCGGGLVGSDPDLVWSPQSPGECVGIDTTGSREFVPRDGGVRLNGALPGQAGMPAVGANVSLGGLDELIRQQNQLAAEASSYITIVYAGSLTSAAPGTGEQQALGSVKELAGAYVWQAYANANMPVKVRIDIANGGQDLASQIVMAQKIADAARQDPTIVGVIGMGRNTPASGTAIHDLAAANLAVVDTTNSSDTLTQAWNFFGLAATNAEEADALAPEIDRVAGKTAVILTRPGLDPYSSQQAAAARAMLRRAGFALVGAQPLTYKVSDNQADFGTSDTSGPLEKICHARPRPSVIYLAGRSDDIPGLMSLLQDDSGCFAPDISVLSGDDLTKSEFASSTTYNVPAHVTVYYATLTAASRTGPGSFLADDLQRALHLRSTPSYSDPFFADGTVALAFDAAHALYAAASQAGGRNGVPSILRCLHITKGATGQIWFNHVHHSVEIIRVTGDANDHPRIAIVSHSATTGVTCPSVIN